MSEPLNIRWSRHFVGTPSTVTVSKDSTGRYFVSILVEEEIEQKEPVNTQVGIDLGLTDAVIVSTGQKFGNPRFFRKDEKRFQQ
ncbi:transposase [Alicyclobacillus suci]|uniref:transposase n=1 Tax=Alicyclobacillus suci TaxID=2816080 RepID=UPI001A8D0FA7|nr:transposase [Alicyclobacillus suci]